MWNPQGFQVISQLPNDTNANTDHFMTILRNPLREEFNHRDQAGHLKPLVVHMSNSSVHTDRQTGDSYRNTQRHECSRLQEREGINVAVSISSTKNQINELKICQRYPELAKEVIYVWLGFINRKDELSLLKAHNRYTE
jgi:hypothetical protein